MGLRHAALLVATFACSALALPAVASAMDYCFGYVPGCQGSIYDDGELDQLLAEAESNGTDDRFLLAPPAQFEGPFSYQSAERVEIIGAERGQDGAVEQRPRRGAHPRRQPGLVRRAA